MSENSNPERPAANSSDVPAGYDQPSQSTPRYQQPAEPQAPAYPQPDTQQAYPQQAYPQPGMQQGYPQQNVQQGYQQQGYSMAGVGEQKSKVVAGVLGILLGSLGIHNFYLGKTKIALIQLLVTLVSFGFLSPLMAIWGLIEGILILVGHENYRTDAKGIPLKD